MGGDGEFGSTSKEEYAKQAAQFLEGAEADGLAVKAGRTGNKRLYEHNSNTLWSYTAFGMTMPF